MRLDTGLSHTTTVPSEGEQASSTETEQTPPSAEESEATPSSEPDLSDTTEETARTVALPLLPHDVLTVLGIHRTDSVTVCCKFCGVFY